MSAEQRPPMRRAPVRRCHFPARKRAKSRKAESPKSDAVAVIGTIGIIVGPSSASITGRPIITTAIITGPTPITATAGLTAAVATAGVGDALRIGVTETATIMAA